MKTKRYTVCFALAALFLVSCESIDVGKAISGGLQSAQEISKANEPIPPDEEYYIGRAVGANILTMYKPYTANAQLTAYLNRICLAITANSPRPVIYNGYYVMILDSDEINAFASSGGHIFITRALLACAQSEDALAGIIAHEIAHIQLEHSISAIRKSRQTQARIGAVTKAAEAVNNATLAALVDTFGDQVSEAISTMVNSGYARDQEFDADKTALGLMAAAGYDPQGLLDMLKVLESSQSSQSGRGFAKTHPSPQDRIRNVSQPVSSYQVPDTRSFREPRYRAVRK
jgi:predicted Zn-dependent protease